MKLKKLLALVTLSALVTACAQPRYKPVTFEVAENNNTEVNLIIQQDNIKKDYVRAASSGAAYGGGIVGGIIAASANSSANSVNSTMANMAVQKLNLSLTNYKFEAKAISAFEKAFASNKHFNVKEVKVVKTEAETKQALDETENMYVLLPMLRYSISPDSTTLKVSANVRMYVNDKELYEEYTEKPGYKYDITKMMLADRIYANEISVHFRQDEAEIKSELELMQVWEKDDAKVIKEKLLASLTLISQQLSADLAPKKVSVEEPAKASKVTTRHGQVVIGTLISDTPEAQVVQLSGGTTNIYI